MSQNIKLPDNRIKTQPTKDIEAIIEKSRNKNLNDNEEDLETDEQRLKYIKEDFGL